MTRRLFSLVPILAVLAAACGEQGHAEVEFGSGTTFTTFVADAQDNVGQMPSVGVSAEGIPYVGYFGFPPELAEGEVAPQRPIDAPPLPAVLLASVDEGVWTRGAVAIEQEVPNSTTPFAPVELPEVASIAPDNVAGTATAVDRNGGIHVAWASDTGIWYGHNADGSAFDVTPVFELDRKLSVAGPLGAPSLALDGSGTPSIAFSHARGGSVEVLLATQEGTDWTVEEVDQIAGRPGTGRQPQRTGVTVTDAGTIVLYEDADGVSAATSGDGRGWTSSTVASGVGAAGLSVASATDGSIVASYYADADVQVATSANGTSWSSTSVATVGASDGDAAAGLSTGLGVDDEGTAYVTWYDPGTDSVRLASGDGEAFEEIETSGTDGGSQPSLGVAPDGSAVYVAWYDAENQNLMLGAYGEVGELALAVPSPTAAPGGETTGPPTDGEECTSAEDGVVTITASSLSFDTSCIEVPAGEPFTIAFDNQDEGQQHNVAAYPTADDLANPIMKGDVITGVDQTEYQVDALEEGEYYFQCDIHPQMNGVLRVVGAGGGGGGGNGGGGGDGAGETTDVVTASSLAFDTDTISLPADQETTLTFDNQDSGVQHNIAIYPSADEVTPDAALFQGDVITGPDQIDYDIPALEAGDYYFHCDVHPQMSGDVVVG